MNKTFTKLLLAGLICTLTWQINPTKQVQAAEIAINEQNFPDEIFRKTVKDFDINHDGILSEQELQRVTKLEIDLRNVVQTEDGHYQQVNGESIEGVEFFNNLDTVVVKSKLPVKGDLQKNRKLKIIYYDAYDLEPQDVSWEEIEKFFPLSQVEYFELENAPKITKITLPSTDKLKTFIVKKCEKVQEIDIKKAKKLKRFSVENTDVKKIDLSKNCELTRLEVHSGEKGYWQQLRTDEWQDDYAFMPTKNKCKIIFPKKNKISTLSCYTADKQLDIRSCKKLKKLYVSQKTKIKCDTKWYKKNRKKLKLYADSFLQNKPKKTIKKKTTILKLHEVYDANYRFVTESEIDGET